MDFRDKLMKILAELSRIIVGATFVFSGFSKAVDPLGTTYKMQDYLISFNLPELLSWVLPVAVVLVVLEFLIGVFLLLGIYRKQAVFAVAAFMLFFLPLTLWIAIKNPVKDCGCFGDAFLISNWETFFKNVVLSLCVAILWFNYKRITPLFSKKMVPVAAFLSFVFAFLFALYNIAYLPVFDFRPYEIGANIPKQTIVDPSKADVVENVFVYSKDGENKEFSEADYPWSDSTWTFVEMKTKVIKEGEKPKIEDFHIESVVYDTLAQAFVADEEITERILSDGSYNFLMISYSLQNANKKYLNAFKQVAQFAKNNGYGFYCLTSSPLNEIDAWRDSNDFDADFARVDERVLKTMIRSNPGLMLLQNGNVLNKWSDNCVPDIQLDKGMKWAKADGLKTNAKGKLAIIVLIFLLPLVVVKLVEVFVSRSKREAHHMRK